MAAARLPVLIVEDEPELRRTFARTLEAAGWPVETAPDGLAAMARLRTDDFDVVVTDIAMPGMDGLDLLKAARTRSLEGLVVQASRGLGGRALVEKRPRLALDYRSSRSITHDYDRAVLGEGISTLFAIPVLVGSRARGVIYCGSWSSSPVGDVAARPAFAVADELSSELRIREEVQRRLALAPPVTAGEASALGRSQPRPRRV